MINSSVRLPGNLPMAANHDNTRSTQYCSVGRTASGSSRLPAVTLMLPASHEVVGQWRPARAAGTIKCRSTSIRRAIRRRLARASSASFRDFLRARMPSSAGARATDRCERCRRFDHGLPLVFVALCVAQQCVPAFRATRRFVRSRQPASRLRPRPVSRSRAVAARQLRRRSQSRTGLAQSAAQ